MFRLAVVAAIMLAIYVASLWVRGWLARKPGADPAVCDVCGAPWRAHRRPIDAVSCEVDLNSMFHLVERRTR